MAGVPASNFQGMSLVVKPSVVTSRIISPAAQERGHGLEQLGAGPERADAGRPEQLVRREGHEVGVPCRHVDRHLRHRLAGVDEHVGPGGSGRG